MSRMQVRSMEEEFHFNKELKRRKSVILDLKFFKRRLKRPKSAFGLTSKGKLTKLFILRDDSKKKKKKGGSFIGTPSPRGSISTKKSRASVSVADVPPSSATLTATPTSTLPTAKLSASGSDGSLKLPEKKDGAPKSPVNKKSLELGTLRSARRGSTAGVPGDDPSEDSSETSTKSSGTGVALHEPLLNLDEGIQKIMRAKRVRVYYN